MYPVPDENENQNIPIDDDFDDESIVEQIELPQPKLNPFRWLIAIGVILGLIFIFRSTIEPGGIAAREKIVDDDGISYEIGDRLSVPASSPNLLNLYFGNGAELRLFPGAVLSVERPRPGDEYLFRLERGRIRLKQPPFSRRVAILTGDSEAGCGGGNIYIEYTEEGAVFSLNLKIIDGAGDIIPVRGDPVALRQGTELFLVNGMQPEYVVPSLNKAPYMDKRLDRWVFPSLVKTESPNLKETIESVCGQAGFSVEFVQVLDWAEELFTAEPEFRQILTLGEFLEKLGYLYGMGYSIDGKNLYINNHGTSIGEWAILNSPSIEEYKVSFEDRRAASEGKNILSTWANEAIMGLRPIESRVQSLMAMIALREHFEDVDPILDLEEELILDSTQPLILRDMALEDMYRNPDISAEDMVYILSKADGHIHAEFFRLLLSQPAPWADSDGIGRVIESIPPVLDPEEKPFLYFYMRMYKGDFEAQELSVLTDSAMKSGDMYELKTLCNFLVDAAGNEDGKLKPETLLIAMKRMFTTPSEELVTALTPGIISIAGRIDYDAGLVLHLSRNITSPDSPMSHFAAMALGAAVKRHIWPEKPGWIENRVREIKDIESAAGPITLDMLGRIDGLKTHAYLVDETLLDALLVRLGLASDPEEKLKLLRLVKAQRGELEGAVGLAWAQGETGNHLMEILNLTDPEILIEAILSLDLLDPTQDEPQYELDELRKFLNEKFASLAGNPDARLRKLALDYFIAHPL